MVTPTDLEHTLTEVALRLFAPGTVAGTLQQIVDLAPETIDGCDAAGILVIEDGRAITRAHSDWVVIELDDLQIANNEGPCLDAASQGTAIYVADLADDHRWPGFGPPAIAAGIRSVLAFPLAPHPLSALNLYARLPAAFGVTDRGAGSIFATLAGIALGSAEQKASDEKLATNLLEALQTRELIGQAQGILMERERITGDQAFEMLRRSSQHLNIKLREVAETLVETGEILRTERDSEPQ